MFYQKDVDSLTAKIQEKNDPYRDNIIANGGSPEYIREHGLTLPETPANWLGKPPPKWRAFGVKNVAEEEEEKDEEALIEEFTSGTMNRGFSTLWNYEEDGNYPFRDATNILYDSGVFFPKINGKPIYDPEALEVEKARWGLENVAMFSLNMTKGLVDLARFQELDDVTQLAYFQALDLYNTKLPMLWYDDMEDGNQPWYEQTAWDGIFRAVRGIASDPATYIGLGIYNQVPKLTAKIPGNTLTNQILKGLLSPTALSAYEGGTWTGVANYQAQQIEIEGAGLNPIVQEQLKIAGEENIYKTETDKGELALNTLIGTLAGPALEQGLPLIPKAGQKLKEVFERTDWSKMSSTTPSIVPPINLRLTKQENNLINDLDIPKKDKTKLRAEVKRIKGRFADNEDFSPVFFKGVKIRRGKDGEPKFKIEWGDKDGKIIKYNYHITPKNMTDDEYREKIVGTMYDDIMNLLERAKAEDPEAELILSQANWYREMQNTIRSEYGGIGDVFADVLSATSAGVNVRQNFNNTMTIMKKFSQGDYDKEIEAFIKHLEEGGNIGNDIPKDFPLIANDAGKLFNTNSPKATIALLGMFRDIKAGGNPKTINFLGNLLGVNPEATIDVWANRYIGKIATGKWYPPFADVEISGAYRKDATFENPDIGSEFGFAQDMFRSVTERLNANSEFVDYMDMDKMEPRDVQAIAWFLEKNRWDKGGWTTEAGGNYSDELQFAGQTDQARVKELRRIIGSKNTLPEDKLKAEAELDTLKVDQERFVVGVSRQQGGDKPTNFEQAELSENLTAPLKDNEMINAFQANNNLGVWKEDNKLQFERSLNMEIIAKPGWDQTEFEKTFINELQKNNQWSGFIAKPLKENVFTGYDDFPNASPGFELFMNRQDGTTDVIKEVNQILADADVPFSYITDSRYKDLPRTQTGSNVETEAGVTGMRIMYIPDYDDAFDPSKASEMKMDAFKKFTEVVDKLGELGYIQTTQHYEFDLRVYNKGTDY